MDKNYDELRKALLDVLDGVDSWIEIQEVTGLPEERCKELRELYMKLYLGENE